MNKSYLKHKAKCNARERQIKAMQTPMKKWTKKDFQHEFKTIKEGLNKANFYVCDTQRKRKIDELMLRWGATMDYLRGLL